MNKFMNQLVEASYKNDILDAGTVSAIGEKLSLRELKQYIRALKLSEKKRTLIVEVPKLSRKIDEDALRKEFGPKTIRYVEKPELLAGIRIIDNDNVYNMNLETNLERMKAYAAE